MFNAERMLGQMLSGALGGAMGGGSGGGRRRGGSLLGGASKAQLGVGLLGIAMAAWEHYQQGQKPAAQSAANAASMPPAPLASMPPPPPPPPPGPEMTRAAPMMDVRQQQAALLIRTMIAAAAADGVIDSDERAGILERARTLGDEPDAVAFLEAEMRQPLGIAELAAQTPGSMRQDVYAAAILAIEVDSDHEHRWLADLASALKIEAADRSAIHQQLGLPG